MKNPIENLLRRGTANQLLNWIVSKQSLRVKLPSMQHRDKPRVCMPAKNVSTFEVNIFYHFWLWAPLLFLTQSKETVS